LCSEGDEFFPAAYQRWIALLILTATPTPWL